MVAEVVPRAHRTKLLVGYLLYLADDKPELFVPLLAKLLPLQVRAKNEGGGPVNRINPNMPVSEMISNFEQVIKSAYMPQFTSPPLIEQD